MNQNHPQGVKLPTNNMEQNLWFPAAKNNGCSLLLPILPSKAKCILTQPQSSWIQAFILIRIPSASHAASSLPDPQSNNSPASHVHTCPSWAAAMATHGNFFPPRQHAARFSASILPFILCESITETKQDTVVHRRAQIIPTSPSLHKHTSPSAHTHTDTHTTPTINVKSVTAMQSYRHKYGTCTDRQIISQDVISYEDPL